MGNRAYLRDRRGGDGGTKPGGASQGAKDGAICLIGGHAAYLYEREDPVQTRERGRGEGGGGVRRQIAGVGNRSCIYSLSPGPFFCPILWEALVCMRTVCVRQLAQIRRPERLIPNTTLRKIPRVAATMADKTFKLNTGQQIPALMFGTASISLLPLCWVNHLAVLPLFLSTLPTNMPQAPGRARAIKSARPSRMRSRRATRVSTAPTATRTRTPSVRASRRHSSRA